MTNSEVLDEIMEAFTEAVTPLPAPCCQWRMDGKPPPDEAERRAVEKAERIIAERDDLLDDDIPDAVDALAAKLLDEDRAMDDINQCETGP